MRRPAGRRASLTRQVLMRLTTGAAARAPRRVVACIAAALGAAVASPLAPLAAQAGAADSGVFVLRTAGGDTVSVERFTRAGDALAGELLTRIPQPMRQRYTATLAPDASVRRFVDSVWLGGAAPAGAPAQWLAITIRGDSATGEVHAGGQTRTQSAATRAGAVVYVNPSMALLEQAVRRARALGGTSVTVPMLSIAGGMTIGAGVRFVGTDSTVVTLSTVEIHLATSPQGTIAGGAIPSQGIVIVRAAGGAATGAALTVPKPDYSPPPGAPYRALEVTVPVGGAEPHALAGTLTLPMGASASRPVPAVVMITGSGLEDRDEAIPIVAGYRPFRDIADTLGRRGIAVLRMDDRGYGGSTGNGATATSADFADDIRAGLAWLRTRPEIDARRLGLVGHSEGGMIAPMVAATDTTLRAIVLMAGPSETGRAIIAYQNRYAVEHDTAIPPARRDSALATAAQQLDSLAATRPWVRFFLDYDPLATARKVRTPVLILQGAADRQVTPGQADSLAAAFRAGGNRDVTVRVFPETNHLFLEDPSGNPAGYAMLHDTHVRREVLGTLADWLATHLGAARAPGGTR